MGEPSTDYPSFCCSFGVWLEEEWHCQTALSAALPWLLLHLCLELSILPRLIPSKGQREVCFAFSCEAVGKTHHSKYQHVPVSSTQLSRDQVFQFSTIAAIIALEIYVCSCRAAVGRNTLTTFVKCSLSPHFELKEDGKWYEREVYFLFLSISCLLV